MLLETIITKAKPPKYIRLYEIQLRLDKDGKYEYVKTNHYKNSKIVSN